MKSNSTQMFLRAHTEVVKPVDSDNGGHPFDKSRFLRKNTDRWAKYALVLDCETTTDERQALVFGVYRFCEERAGEYVCIEEGFFYANDFPATNADEFSILKNYAETNESEVPVGFDRRIRLYTRSEFMENVFWKAAYEIDAVVTCFNAPFDLTRLAVDCKVARKKGHGWSLIMFQDRDPISGQVRENPFRQRVKMRPKDSKAAFIRFGGVSIHRKNKNKTRYVPYKPGRFLDLRTLGWALRNESYSLRTGCKAFKALEKFDHAPTGHISLEEIEYARQDVRCTTSLLNQMRKEFDRHPTDLIPERAVSPASMAKAYLRKMGIVPPMEKFRTSPSLLGIAMQAYYGGRAECHIRHLFVPVMFLDFLSEYSTVNTLMGLWPLLIAESLKTEEVTQQVRTLLNSLTLGSCFDRAFWKELTFFALVQPDDDILPIRIVYNGETTNIGVNHLTSKEPVWFAGPDLVASTLLNGRPPKIIRAIQLVGKGVQESLENVSLRGIVEIDPGRDDFFKEVIEARARVKKDGSLPEDERTALAYFLKILASSGSYGLFVEVNPKPAGLNRKTGKPARARIKVFSGESEFLTTSPVIEEHGTWYYPPFASLITAAGRLLLAMLERSVSDKGGTYLLCDTDSMAIVASEKGGSLTCYNGDPNNMEGAVEINGLSWSDVLEIVSHFNRINPYERSAVPNSILKVEDVNFDSEDKQRELCGYGIAAKRYALFTESDKIGIRIESASAHGLGFLYSPKAGFDEEIGVPEWVVDGWKWILQDVTKRHQEEPGWFSLSAVMRIAITTPEVLKQLQLRQRQLPYADRAKAFNFVLSPILDRTSVPDGPDGKTLTLIAPFTSDLTRLHKIDWINVRTGSKHRLARPGMRCGLELEAKTYGDIVGQFRWHPESKSMGPDGFECKTLTSGILQRGQFIVSGFRYIGKETDRRWEQGEDFSLIEPVTVEYSPNETERLGVDQSLRECLCDESIRTVAREARVSVNTVKAARRGKRIRKRMARKLWEVVRK